MRSVLFPWLILATAWLAAGEFHVATSGDDGGPGTADRPFASLERARDAVRELKQAEGLPSSGVTVWIHEGTYRPRRPLALTRADSGGEGAPVRYRASPGAAVRITGSLRVEGFRVVAAAAARDRLDVAARDHVVEADLGAAGIDDLGAAVERARRLELFFADQPMQLARWPDDGFVRIVDVVGDEPMQVHGLDGNREGRFTYEGDRARRWTSEKDAWLHGYWFWDWSDSYERIQSIDVETKTIATAPPYHHYGYRKGQRYYAINVLAELDRPGEWYLDRETRKLYFWPPTAVDDSPAEVSVLSSILDLEDCSYVSFEGLLLEGTRGTAVRVRGGQDVLVRGCTIRNTGSRGVEIGGGRRHAVVDCEIYRVGEGGIGLSGGDRRSLSAAGHEARNNHIHHFGRLYRTYRPAVAVRGVGNRVAHNHIHHGPHNAIQLGGNEHRIEFNEIHHVCFETGDVGAFYMGRDWTERGTVIRHNFFHDIRGPGLHGAMAVYLDDAASGMTILGNLFVRAGRAAFIGGGRDNRVENNVFIDCEPSVHIDARGVGWMRNHIEQTMPERLRALPYGDPPWRDRYPELLTLLDDEPGRPKGNVVRRNLSFGGRWLDIQKPAEGLVEFADNLVGEDPGFVDPEAARRGERATDLRLRDDAAAWKRGFEPIPLERIGRLPGELEDAAQDEH